jgi:hypothetical protein
MNPFFPGYVMEVDYREEDSVFPMHHGHGKIRVPDGTAIVWSNFASCWGGTAGLQTIDM